jgi:sugar-phosphatase
MVDAMSRDPHPKPGLRQAFDCVRRRGLALAIASSSPYRLIRAVVSALGLDVETIYSAEDEPFGKPHPGVYLETARRLGVHPLTCVAFEDSLPGVIAAKAARMRCVAVPEPPNDSDPRFVLADAVVRSLDEVDDALWTRLGC